LTKFLANLAFAPVFGALAGVSAAASPTGIQGSGKGFVGIAAAMGAFGPQFQPGPEGYGGGEGGGEGGAARVSSIGALNTAGDIVAGGSRVRTLYTLAAALRGTPYSQPLRNDCSGMVAQLVDAAVGLPPGGPRFATGNEAQALTERGFLPGLGGTESFNIGWNTEHTAATLPGGQSVETGRGPGGSFGFGGPGAREPGFTSFMHLPMLGYDSGGPVPIVAHGGEWVINKNAVDHYGPGFMQAVNAMSFQGGGGVPDMDNLAFGGGGGATKIGGEAPLGGYGHGPAGPGGGAGGAIPSAIFSGAGAGAASMGIGIAAQIAMQEIQRAIQYGGQVAGIAAGGLMETFLPAGSKLAQGSWLTKIAGGLAGAAPQLPNMAGQMTKAAGGQQQPSTLPSVHIENMNNYGHEDAMGKDIVRHQEAAYNSNPNTGSR
jgi:hypothetical protein